MFQRTKAGWRLRFPRRIPVWYSSRYRLPIANLGAATGMDPRRADFVAWYLADRRVIPADLLREPEPISFGDMARVHTDEYLESLTEPKTLARIFATMPDEISVDEVMHTVRLACGATLAAARESLRTHLPTVNLLGGFHHAGKGHGGGFCPVNDIAIAVAALRAEGFAGFVRVIDVDAHQPDGTADCLLGDPRTWIGSLSGASFSELPNLDETILSGASEATYLSTLDKLLGRMPKGDLTFVVAGGDVLGGDRLATMGLSLGGVRRRDLAIIEALDGEPSVWLPAGGYSENAWRVLAGTVLALVLRTRVPIRSNYDPMRARFKFVSKHMGEAELSDGDAENQDIAAALGLGRAGPRRLLDYYTAAGLEYALFRYGLLEHVRRLGYEQLHVTTDSVDQGDRMRLLGRGGGAEHVLIEVVLEKQKVDGSDVLYIHWLTLRHPLAKRDLHRPILPGQDAAGLGLAREVAEMLYRMAARLNLSGVAFRPAWFHVAYTARYRFSFSEPARQARFEAMIRDLKKMPLLEATTAVAEHRVRLNGEPYTWEAETMVAWLKPADHTPKTAAPALDSLRFTVDEPLANAVAPA